MDRKDIYAIAAIIVLVILGYITVNRLFPVKGNVEKEKETITEYSTKYDTVVREYYYKPVYINKKSDTIKITDTVTKIATHPFIAELKDAIVAGDTIGAAYAFPKDSFYLRVLPRPDKIMEITKTNTIIKTEIEKREWWIDFLTHLGTGALGYGVGKIR